MTDVPQQSGRSTLLWAVALAGATGLAYWAFLGWDQHKETDPVTGSQTGPYQAWQIVGLGVVLAVLVFGAARRGRPWLASLVVAVVLTASFTVDAATDADGDGLWPVGAALVAVGSLLGTGLVAGIGTHLGRRHRAR